MPLFSVCNSTPLHRKQVYLHLVVTCPFILLPSFCSQWLFPATPSTTLSKPRLLSSLRAARCRQWTLRGCRPDTWRPSDHPLPSDCRFREDLAWLKRGDVVKAQEWKEILEQRQRADKKERGDAHGH